MCTQFINFFPKFIFSSAVVIKGQEILSKAFSKSTNNIRPSISFSLHPLMTSNKRSYQIFQSSRSGPIFQMIREVNDLDNTSTTCKKYAYFLNARRLQKACQTVYSCPMYSLIWSKTPVSRYHLPNKNQIR